MTRFACSTGRLVVLAVATIVAGCDRSNPTSPSDLPFLEGMWSGTASDSSLGGSRMTWTLTQRGTRVSGSVHAVASSVGATVPDSYWAIYDGTVSGVVEPGTLSFTITGPHIAGFPGCSVTITGAALRLTASHIEAVYSGNNSCTGPFSSGYLHLQKQVAV